MSDATGFPPNAWLSYAVATSRWGRQTTAGTVEYVRADAIRTARIEGYEIARKEAAEMGCHLRRPELVEGLK